MNTTYTSVYLSEDWSLSIEATRNTDEEGEVYEILLAQRGNYLAINGSPSQLAKLADFIQDHVVFLKNNVNENEAPTVLIGVNGTHKLL